MVRCKKKQQSIFCRSDIQSIKKIISYMKKLEKVSTLLCTELAIALWIAETFDDLHYCLQPPDGT